MNTEKWFRDRLESFKEDFEFRLEKFILNLTEKISERMKQKKISRTNLAALLKVSRPAVTKILDGNSNFTIRKLLSLADALDLDLEIDFKEKHTAWQTILDYELSYGFKASEGEGGSYILPPYKSGTTETITINDASASTPILFSDYENIKLVKAVNA